MDKFYIHTPTGQIEEMDGKVLQAVLRTVWHVIRENQTAVHDEAKVMEQVARLWRTYPELM